VKTQERNASGTLADARASFPALERTHNGLPVAYFDGPGGTQVAAPVVDAMRSYLCEHNANTHWEYPSSAETDALIAASRSALGDFMGCESDEVVFGLNMTTLTFHIARALGWAWGEGDEILVTDLDHHANVAPWRVLERERGVTVRSVPFDPVSGELIMSELARMLTPKTRLLAIGAASNALGTVNDLDEIMMMVRGVDALVYVDAVHSAPHFLPDVREIDCDFLACSAYKFYGPHVGVLYARREVGARLAVPRLEPAPSDMPERLETGTGNHEGIVGAAAAVDFLASLGSGSSRRARLQNAYSTLHERGQALVGRLWTGLARLNAVTLFGPEPDRPRTATIAFNLREMSPGSVVRELAARGLFLSHGDFYAATVIERLGVGADGVVRAGAACYTSEDEVERLIEGVKELAGNR
jgi:cysteine desulfurase family protein (TIGR01976 family)